MVTVKHDLAFVERVAALGEREAVVGAHTRRIQAEAQTQLVQTVVVVLLDAEALLYLLEEARDFAHVALAVPAEADLLDAVQPDARGLKAMAHGADGDRQRSALDAVVALFLGEGDEFAVLHQ